MSLKKYQTAKTAYGLLSNIIRIIEKDPRHLRMQDWKTSCSRLMLSEVPACGTVCCIGGWIDTLTQREAYHNAAKTLGFLRMPRRDQVAEYNKEEQQMDELFYGDLCMDSEQGTVQHARKVVRLIRRFQKTHRARLLKTAVTIGGDL